MSKDSTPGDVRGLIRAAVQQALAQERRWGRGHLPMPSLDLSRKRAQLDAETRREVNRLWKALAHLVELRMALVEAASANEDGVASLEAQQVAWLDAALAERADGLQEALRKVVDEFDRARMAFGVAHAESAFVQALQEMHLLNRKRAKEWEGAAKRQSRPGSQPPRTRLSDLPEDLQKNAATTAWFLELMRLPHGMGLLTRKLMSLLGGEPEEQHPEGFGADGAEAMDQRFRSRAGSALHSKDVQQTLDAAEGGPKHAAQAAVRYLIQRGDPKRVWSRYRKWREELRRKSPDLFEGPE